MRTYIYAAITALALAAGAPLAASAADPAAIPFDGTRPSSVENWPGMMDNAVAAAAQPATPAEEPRPSSLGNWPGMTNNAVPAQGPTASPFDGVRPSSAH
jgi:hypothetical protein